MMGSIGPCRSVFIRGFFDSDSDSDSDDFECERKYEGNVRTEDRKLKTDIDPEAKIWLDSACSV